ncbi:MAG: HigA family addiction module antitoxin [Vulcanimicrobiaceae bacterium]
MLSSYRLPKNRRPTHPGVILEETRADLRLTQQQMAASLGITRGRYAGIESGKRAVSLDTALRLERVFGTDAQSWMNMQIAVDLWDALHDRTFDEIKKLKPHKNMGRRAALT